MTMRAAALALMMLFAGAIAPANAAEETTIATPRGAKIVVAADFPQGAGPFPTVVLAPGTGSRKQKINDVVAAELVGDGFAVFRFDWAYYLKDPKALPSDANRAPEIEDFTTAIAFARRDKRVDAGNLIIGGKSRGTIIGWRTFRADPSIRAILQLTPVCTKDGFTPDGLYPNLAEEKRRSLWITGDEDPACKVSTLYGFIANAGGPARIDILHGDHSLAIDTTSTLAARLTAAFAKQAIASAE